MNLPTLSQLLSPFPVDAFTRQFDNRAPVVLRPVISTPLDLPRLDAFVAERGLRWPTIHLESAAGAVHPDGYSEPVAWGRGQAAYLVDVGALRAGLERGERVVLAELQRHHGPTALLLRAYEQCTHMRGSATAVLAPAEAEPRTPPVLAEHQYLLQCHGTRHCTVTGPDGEAEDFELVVGCVLYVPPGHQVSTAPLRGPSLSLDMRLRPIRVRDLAAAELRSIPRDRLRASVPVGLGQDPTTLATRWSELVNQLLDDVDHQETLEALVDRYVQTRLPLLRGQLKASTQSIRVDTAVRRRPVVMYRIVDKGDSVDLRFHGKTISFPRGTDEVVQYMASSERWTPADLENVPPEHQLAIVKRLVAEGFCELV